MINFDLMKIYGWIGALAQNNVNEGNNREAFFANQGAYSLACPLPQWGNSTLTGCIMPTIQMTKFPYP